MKERSTVGARLGDLAPIVRVATALGTLALGALIYALVRPHAAIFLPAGWHHPVLSTSGLPLVATLIGSAPTFLHAFALSLLIVVATEATTPRGRGGCCAAVCAVEIAFEVAQHTVVAALLLGSAADLPTASGISGLWRSYLARGTFDPLDLVAACAGCLAACAVYARARHDRQTSSGASHASA